MSAVTLRARARELLLPLVLFPLMIPVILATIRCMENILRIGELGEALALAPAAFRFRCDISDRRRLDFRSRHRELT